jgi:hypothetical protein
MRIFDRKPVEIIQYDPKLWETLEDQIEAMVNSRDSWRISAEIGWCVVVILLGCMAVQRWG